MLSISSSIRATSPTATRTATGRIAMNGGPGRSRSMSRPTGAIPARATTSIAMTALQTWAGAARSKSTGSPQLTRRKRAPKSRGALLMCGCLSLDERQEVCVDGRGLGERHAVREALVSLERALPQKLGRQGPGVRIGHDLVVVAVADQHRHVDLLQVLGEVGLGEGDDAVVVRLGAAHHALAPPVADQALGDL